MAWQAPGSGVVVRGFFLLLLLSPRPFLPSYSHISASMKRRRKHIRTKGGSEDDDDDEQDDDALRTVKAAQALRRAEKGVTAEALLESKKADEARLAQKTEEAEEDGEKPARNLAGFAAENTKANFADDDERMRRYVETELARRRGEVPSDTNAPPVASAPPSDAELLRSAKGLEYLGRVKTNEPDNDVGGTAITGGLEEVELDLDVKIKNVEATEAARRAFVENVASEKVVKNFTQTDKKFAKKFKERERERAKR